MGDCSLLEDGASGFRMSMEISPTPRETAGNAIISDAILASRGMVQEGVLLSNAN